MINFATFVVPVAVFISKGEGEGLLQDKEVYVLIYVTSDLQHT